MTPYPSGHSLFGKNILVTGGAGFIGHHLVRGLFGHFPAQIAIVDDLSTGRLSNLDEFRHMPGFLFLQKNIEDLTTDEIPFIPDYVFHLAAVVSVPGSFADPMGTYRVNSSGFVNMLELSRVWGVRKVVYASSSAVYGDQEIVPIQEDAPLNPLSPYGLSKLMNEIYAENYHGWFGLKSAGFRFFNVYGPGQRSDSPYSGVISIFSERMERNAEISIYGDGEQVRDFVYVEDVVNALVLGALSDHPLSVYNVGSDQDTSINELFSLIRSFTGYSLKPVYREAREGDIRRSSSDLTRIRRELGYEPGWALPDGLQKLREYSLQLEDILA